MATGSARTGLQVNSINLFIRKTGIHIKTRNDLYPFDYEVCGQTYIVQMLSPFGHPLTH